MPVLPDIPGDGRDIVVGQGVFEMIARAAEIGPRIAASANVRVSQGAPGVSLEVKTPRPMIRAIIPGTLTTGGIYTGNTINQNVNGITTTNVVGSTASLGMVNTNNLLTLMNLAEYGTSWHFVSTNTVVQCYRGNVMDTTANPPRPIYEFYSPLPKVLPVTLSKINGNNGTAVASSTATFNNFAYSGSYNGQTLFTTQTAVNVLVAGTITIASWGWAVLNEGANTYSLFLGIEPVGGPVCAS